jgi:hypothetical protein
MIPVMLALIFAVLLAYFCWASFEFFRVEREVHWPFVGGGLLSLVLLFFFL